MKRIGLIIITFLAFQISLSAQYIIDPGDPGADFGTLEEAFSFINNSGIDLGDVTLEIAGSTTENATAVLYESGYGASFYSSVTIFPTSPGLSISGDMDGPLIQLSSAANVTFDGRVNLSGGVDLIITNSNTGPSASTIMFIESANNNTVQYCNLMGAETGTSSGIILFSTSSVGVGNDNNAISNNMITADPVGRPLNALFSLGTSGSENSANVISSNEFFNFLNPASESNGININEYSSDFTISDNSFYESAPFSPSFSVAYYVIKINTTTGINFTVTGNYIGGNAALCTGTWDKQNTTDNMFYGIYISTGSGTASSMQNNRIQNFDWSNLSSAIWTGIQIAGGDVNIGTSSGNYIGDITGNNSITVTNVSSGTIYGIYITGTGSVSCQNNNIGSITSVNSNTANGVQLFGINKSSFAGTTSIINNTIGSASTANSIYASSVSTAYNQVLVGISNNGTGDITISNNTVANLNNAGTRTLTGGTGRVAGIYSTTGTNIISDNIVHDLKHANGNGTAGATPSVCGISLGGSATALRTVSGNTVYNLSNTFPTFSGYVIGIFFLGNSGENIVTGNFVHSLSVTGASSTSAFIIGIKLSLGVINTSNNIISLGGNTKTSIYGIYESGGSGNTNRVYFNTVFIEGNVSSGTNKSYAFYNLNSLSTRNIRNNLFVNKRSTDLASSLHYAAYFVASGGTITCDYNDYFVSGTGSVLGFYGANVASLPIVSGQDANSYSIDPGIAVEGSTTDTDYTITQDLIGITGTGITTDYAGDPRNNPTMGAWERLVNKWQGNSTTAWNLAGNWSASVVPLENANIIFDTAPLNDCYLNADHSVNNITNGSAKLLVTNSKQLIIKGDLIFSGSAQIDATSASSTLVYAGASAQTIDASYFVSGKTYNLTIDNTPGVTLNTDFTVDNALTINSGKLLTVSAGKQLTVTGTLTNSAGNSGLVIKSDANGNDGKLINDTPSVPGTVELFLSGGAGVSGPAFHYFVPPVGSMTIGSTIADVKTNLGLTNFNGDLMSYSEIAAGPNKDLGWQYFDGYGTPPTTPFSTIVSSMGYNIYLTAADKITFTGSLNGPAHTFSSLSFTNQGWNLVGNPYPCNYDLTGITALTGTGDNVDNTVYFNHDGGYAYWNVETGAGTTGYSAIMPPMQGFFVHVTATGQSLTLPIGFKTASAAAPSRSKGAEVEYSKSASQVKKIKLVLNNGPVPDETIVCLIDNATNGFDGDYDAYKFFGGGSTTPFIYTNLNSLKYAINSVQEPAESTSITIPVTVVLKNQGTYKIDITEFENLGDLPVVLRHGAIETNLSKDTSYSFTSASGTFTDFQLIIGYNNTPTGVEPVTKQKLKTWYSNYYLYINCPDDITAGKGSLVIYDLQGKAVYTNNLVYITPGQTIQQSVNLPNGVYITHVIVNDQPFVAKIVVF